MKATKEVKMILIEGNSVAFYINGRRLGVFTTDEPLTNEDISYLYTDQQYWI